MREHDAEFLLAEDVSKCFLWPMAHFYVLCWIIAGNVLFYLILRNSVLQAFMCVLKSWFKVRWKVLLQTPESDNMELHWLLLKILSYQIVGNNFYDFFQILEQFDNFKSGEIGPKCSGFDVWLTVECTRIGTYKRAFNQPLWLSEDSENQICEKSRWNNARKIVRKTLKIKRVWDRKSALQKTVRKVRKHLINMVAWLHQRNSNCAGAGFHTKGTRCNDFLHQTQSLCGNKLRPRRSLQRYKSGKTTFELSTTNEN